MNSRTTIALLRLAAVAVAAGVPTLAAQAGGPPVNDLCADAFELETLPASASGDTCTATTDAVGFCGTSEANQGVWYTVVGNGNVLQASTCNPGSDFDTKIQVFTGTCDALVCVGGNDDAVGAPAECDLNGLNRLSRVEWCSEAGTTYFIYVGGFLDACGLYELTVDDIGPCPAGRCCYTRCVEDIDGNGVVDVDDLVTVILAWGPCGEPPCPADIDDSGTVDVDDLVSVILAWGVCGGPECDMITEAACAELGGEWDADLTCADNPCPVPPDNDDCGSCTVIDALPYSDVVDNATALPGLPVGSCNLDTAETTQNDVWWCFTPEEDCIARLTVDVAYDGVITVYTGAGCEDLAELACADEPDNPAFLVFAATAGETYFIQVGDWGTSPGGGETTLSLECTDPAITGACCLGDGSCVELNIAECGEAGGDYQGDGTACGDVECPQPGACCFPDGSCTVGAEVGGADCADAGGDYQGDGTSCDPNDCPQPSDNEVCATCTEILALPYFVEFDNSTAQPSPPPGSCNTGSATEMQNDVWWCFTPAEDCLAELVVDMTYDGILAVYVGPCDDLVEIACVDEPDDPAEITFAAEAGVTYLIQVGDWGTFPGGGATTLSLDCTPAGGTGACCLIDGSCVETDIVSCMAQGGDYFGNDTACGDVSCPQPGACCFPDGSCTASAEVGGADCADAGGMYAGDDTVCEPNPCPQPPANDLCADAIDLTVPGTAFGNTCAAADDDTGTCGTSSPNQGVWYTVTGTGNVLTASTCNPGSDFDTKIQVFCGACDALVCVGGNDDAVGAPPECSLNGLNRFSLVEWCSAPGETYYVYVGGFGSTCGNFELTVVEGDACDNPPDCGSVAR